MSDKSLTGSGRGWRRHGMAPVLGLALAFTLPNAGVSAQADGPGWRFMADPLADLWFHGMALVDPVGPGPSPLYDPAYPSTVRKAKTSVGVPSTALDGRLGYFRNAFRSDPAFEVLHFVPLYFPQAGRLEVLSALKELAMTSEGVPRAPTDRTAFGLAAVGSVLTSPGQRRVLGEFVLSLENEWTEFYEDYHRSSTDEREAVLRSLQATWSREYRTALAPFLDAVDMTAGLVILSPPLGMEGRVFTGSSHASWDNVIAVSTPRVGEDPSTALFAMIREVSFPMVRRAIAPLSPVPASRDLEEQRAGRAAVRSGALILEAFCPDEVADYQSFFLSHVTAPIRTGTATDEAFRAAYPLEEDLENALRKEMFPQANNRR